MCWVNVFVFSLLWAVGQTFCSIPLNLSPCTGPHDLCMRGSLVLRNSKAQMDLGAAFEKRPPAAVFEDLASFSRESSAMFDSYGSGSTLQEFEMECAQLLGKPAACFFLTGTQAQNAALEAHEPNGSIAVHPTSHIVHHNCLLEGKAQSDEFLGLARRHLPRDQSVASFGKMENVPTFEDVRRVLDGGNAGVLVLELPQRMNGGGVMTWSDLREVRRLASDMGVKMHMDGARLWEVQPYFQQPLPEICALFDSVYVSFYKGVAAMSGAMLLGSPDFIARARLSQGAMGGKGNTMIPYALHCQLQLRRSIPKFQSRFERLQQVVALLSDPALGLSDVLRFDPPRPQAAMIHVYVKGESIEELEEAHSAAMNVSGVRLWNFLRGRGHSCSASPGSEFYFEWLMGEANSKVPDESIVAGWTAFRNARQEANTGNG